jgi:NAD(P)H-dependent FMN reductase
MRLGLIIGSTRPTRLGDKPAGWLAGVAEATEGIELDVIDLRAIALPLFAEPQHPRTGNYTRAETVAWSQRVGACDAFVIVTPEYNHAAPPAVVNAVTFLLREWQYKPVAFVSYGGVSGGLRAVQQLKLQFLAVEAVPIADAVVIPLVFNQIEEGEFKPNQMQAEAASVMLEKLRVWVAALAPMRRHTMLS